MISRDEVLQVLKTRGPSFPVQIKKVLGSGDTFIIGAVLTELREAGKIKVSNTKIGGSPYYYVPEHSPKLVNLIPQLGEKERRTALLLQERKILQDTAQDPLIRVCLRQIKDFSVRLDVRINEGTELFWKWYLLPNSEAEILIKQNLGILPKKEEKKIEEPLKHTPAKAPLPLEEPRVPTLPKKEVLPMRKEPLKEDIPKPLKPTLANKILKEIDDSDDAFLKKLLIFFAEKHIQILIKDIKRKNADIEFELSVPSAVGCIEYYCKAKNKKKNNDGDLSSAYVQGQLKKLPVLYITTGDVTKKAKEMLKREFKGLVLLQL